MIEKAGDKTVFLQEADELSSFINDKANELFAALKNLNKGSLGEGDHWNDYFFNHHLGNRLFFSIQNSAHILYESVKICGKPLNAITAIDYGAGLGTLFMLGGKLGLKRFDYNDYLPEWQNTAKLVCDKIGARIQSYITGDINAVIDFAAKENLQYDIIVSRNVIEHIYSLDKFYTALYQHNSSAVIYSTTTANYHNPVMKWYHMYIHKKFEKAYRQHRINEIKKIQPAFSEEQLIRVAEVTRGKAQTDFKIAIEKFSLGEAVEKDSHLRTNYCDPVTGVWNEHLLTKHEYKEIINKAGFKMFYTSGYWDTHYQSSVKNTAGKLFNRLIKIAGKQSGVAFSPFVNVVAYN